jgi:nicotinamidase/pyrazinamidase
MSSFVIVVDVQGDFMRASGALPVPEAETLIAPMTAWLAALRPEDTAGVLFTFDTHVPAVYAKSEEAKLFPPHCVRDTDGWRLALDPGVLDPAIPRYRLEKGVFDMWAEDDTVIARIDSPDAHAVARDAFFADLQRRGIEDVTVIGVAADFCVRWAVEGLTARGFRVTVPAAMTRGIERQIDRVAQAEWDGASVFIA